MSDDKISLLLASISVIFWSTVATAFKIALHFVTPIQLLTYSSLFSSLILLLILSVRKKVYVFKYVKTQHYLISAVIGFLNPFLYYLVLFKAYSLLPAQEALALNYTWAIVLTILTSIFQRKRIRLISYFALIISFFGVLIIISKGSIVTLKPSNSYGAILALSSSLIWGISWVMNVISPVDDEARLFLNFSFGFIFSFVFFLFFSGFVIPSTNSWIPILYVSVFEMGITFVLWNKALKKASNPARVNNMIYASPIISVFIINIVLKEKLHLYTLVGLILILGGILIQNTSLVKLGKK